MNQIQSSFTHFSFIEWLLFINNFEVYFKHCLTSKQTINILK